MPITPTQEDVGRRVIYAPASKHATPQDQMHGVLYRVWDGIPYIKYDWQPEQAPPIPESPSLLSWDEDPDVTEHEKKWNDASPDLPETFDDPDNEPLTPDDEVYGAGANEPAASDLQGEGGDFGGGGASADWSDPTPDSDTETSTDDSDSGDSDV